MAARLPIQITPMTDREKAFVIHGVMLVAGRLLSRGADKKFLEESDRFCQVLLKLTKQTNKVRREEMRNRAAVAAIGVTDCSRRSGLA